MSYINSVFVLVLVNDHIYNHNVIIERKEINNTITQICIYLTMYGINPCSFYRNRSYK